MEEALADWHCSAESGRKDVEERIARQRKGVAAHED